MGDDGHRPENVHQTMGHAQGNDPISSRYGARGKFLRTIRLPAVQPTFVAWRGRAQKIVGAQMKYLCRNFFMVCLLGIATSTVESRQAPAPQMAEQVFKNVQIMKGIPVDEFMDTMGMFS